MSGQQKEVNISELRKDIMRYINKEFDEGIRIHTSDEFAEFISSCEDAADGLQHKPGLEGTDPVHDPKDFHGRIVEQIILGRRAYEAYLEAESNVLKQAQRLAEATHIERAIMHL